MDKKEKVIKEIIEILENKLQKYNDNDEQLSAIYAVIYEYVLWKHAKEQK